MINLCDPRPCYLCTEDIDGNETPFTDEFKLCPLCAAKLRAMGLVDGGGISFEMGPVEVSVVSQPDEPGWKPSGWPAMTKGGLDGRATESTGE